MAFQPGQIDVTLEVREAPGGFLRLSPESPAALVVDKKDMARFVLIVTPTGGYAGPFWMMCKNLSGECVSFTVNPVPAGGGETTLEIDTNSNAWPVAPPFLIGIEAWDVLPTT